MASKESMCTHESGTAARMASALQLRRQSIVSRGSTPGPAEQFSCFTTGLFRASALPRSIVTFGEPLRLMARANSPLDASEAKSARTAVPPLD